MDNRFYFGDRVRVKDATSCFREQEGLVVKLYDEECLVVRDISPRSSESFCYDQLENLSAPKGAACTALKVGDVVRLKSGGPLLTVGKLSEDGKFASIVWFNDGKLEHSSLGVESLLAANDADDPMNEECRQSAKVMEMIVASNIVRAGLSLEDAVEELIGSVKRNDKVIVEQGRKILDLEREVNTGNNLLRLEAVKWKESLEKAGKTAEALGKERDVALAEVERLKNVRVDWEKALDDVRKSKE